MIFGSERKVLFSNPFQKILWTIRGDFHIGRWIRYFQLKKVLKDFPITPARILDAGCGTGQTAFFLERRFPNALIEAVDISLKDIETAREIAKKTDRRVKFQQRH